MHASSSPEHAGQLPLDVRDGKPGMQNPVNEFVTVSAQLATNLDATNTPILPPVVVNTIEKRVKEAYLQKINETNDVNPHVKVSEDDVFSISVVQTTTNLGEADTSDLVLMGMKEYVEMGQGLIDYFVRQAQIWHNLKVLAEPGKKTKSVIIEVPLYSGMLESEIKIVDLEEYYKTLGDVSL